MITPKIQKITIEKEVGQSGSGGRVYLPKFLVGKTVKIVFYKELTEVESRDLEIHKLKEELRNIRSKRKNGTG